MVHASRPDPAVGTFYTLARCSLPEQLLSSHIVEDVCHCVNKSHYIWGLIVIIKLFNIG